MTGMLEGGPVLIAGAGIDGLTAAACLLQAGVPVQVFEQAPALGEVGAGIQISANAARVYAHLGLLPAVEAAGALPETYSFRMFDTGETLHSILLGDGYRARHGVPYVTIHRADLHAALVARVQALAPAAIRLGVRATGVDQDGAGVTLHLDGGSARGSVLIGADGIRSAIRRQILGDTPAEYTGDAAWRVILPMQPEWAEHGLDIVSIWVGPRRHAVTYPLRGGRLVNFVGCVETPGWADESWTATRPWEAMAADFEGWHPAIRAIVEATPRGGVSTWALRIRAPVANWTEVRVTLLGDAAHPTLPYMAQGAAMAVEDAVVLARALLAHAPERALAAYQAARLERTARIVNEPAPTARCSTTPTATPCAPLSHGAT